MFDSENEGGGEATEVRDDKCEDQIVYKAVKVLKETTGVQSLVWKFFHFKGTTKGPDNPRFKNLKVTESKQGRETVYREIDHELRELAKKLPKSGEVEVAQKRKKKKLCLDFVESEDDKKEKDDDLINEIRAYRNEAMLDRNEDPLAWWRTRRTQYPNLCTLQACEVWIRDLLLLFFQCFYSGNIFAAPGPVLRLREFSRL